MDLLLTSVTLDIPNLWPTTVLGGEEGAQPGGVLRGGQGAGEDKIVQRVEEPGFLGVNIRTALIA